MTFLKNFLKEKILKTDGKLNSYSKLILNCLPKRIFIFRAELSSNENKSDSSKTKCPVEGCNGKGSTRTRANGDPYQSHSSEEHCPNKKQGIREQLPLSNQEKISDLLPKELNKFVERLFESVTSEHAYKIQEKEILLKRTGISYNKVNL
jgi:hypothetical protein